MINNLFFLGRFLMKNTCITMYRPNHVKINEKFGIKPKQRGVHACTGYNGIASIIVVTMSSKFRDVSVGLYIF